MQLPDFSKAIEFIRLRQQMGVIAIPILQPVEFVQRTEEKREVGEIDEADKRLLEKLRSSAVEVSSSDLDVQGGLLTYGDRKVVAYIRDQRKRINTYTWTSDYRFHLCDCATMQRMRSSGRERRYLATQRSDGWFEVNYRNGGATHKTTAQLKLCHHCRKKLDMMGLYEEPFSLKEYFKRHDSGVPRTVRRIETVEHFQEYQPNQDELSREYRKAADYRCQVCKVDCRKKPGLLQLHHRDGDTANNVHRNLAVLCVDCHARQPYHGQMGRSASDQKKIEQITELRKQQKTPTLTPT